MQPLSVPGTTYHRNVRQLRFVSFVFLIACGDDGSSVMPDAPGNSAVDAAADAGPNCSGAAPVTVSAPVFDPARVQLTFKLVSHDPSGFMCAMKDAGNTSEATTTIDVPPMGMVTMVVDDGDMYHGLFTWTEVQPGDQLLFPSLNPRGVTAKMVDVEVTVPAVTGVTTYDVYVQCEHGGGGLSDPAPAGVFTKTVECPSNATALAVMIEADNGNTSQYAVSAVTPIAASGKTTLTVGAYAPAALPTVTFRATVGFDRAYAGFVPGATADFHSVTLLSFAGNVTDPVTLGPRAVPASWHHNIVAAIAQSAEPTHALQISRQQAAPMPIDVNVTTDLLPLLSAQLGDGLPRPSITWSTARAATADAVYVNAGKWVMVTRAQPGTVRFPEVPAGMLPTGPA